MRTLSRAQTINPNTAGGFTVPQEEVKRFWDVIMDDMLLRFITIYEEPAGRSNSIVVENDQAEGVWTGEGAAIAPVDSVFASISTQNMPKVTATAVSSVEALADIDAEGRQGRPLLDSILAVRTRRSLHRAIAVGTGVGQPTGLFPVAGGLPGITGAIDSASISALFQAIHPNHLASPRCAWLMSPVTLATLINAPMQPDWLRMPGDGQYYLLSKSIILNPYAPVNEVVFGNLRYYGLKRAPEVVSGVDNESLALEGKEVRYAWIRADGKPVIAASADTALAVLRPA